MDSGPVFSALLGCVQFLTAVVILVSTYVTARDELLRRKSRTEQRPSPLGESEEPPVVSPMDERQEQRSQEDVTL